jgi:hypothetical protein
MTCAKAIALVAQLTSIPLEELDRGGINLWVRHRMNGTDFCDWQKAAKLKLGAQWAA